jgi:hypothetical protein
MLDAVCRLQNNSAHDIVKAREVQKCHSPGNQPGLVLAAAREATPE